MNYHTYYSGKFGGDNVWRKWIDEDLVKKFGKINRSAKSLIVTTNLDGFSLMICQIHQTILLLNFPTIWYYLVVKKP